jgi:E3 Ubiquitin ligase
MHASMAVDLPSALTDVAPWALLGLGIGVYLFYRGFGLLRRQRLILNTPRSTVRGAAVGLVEVSGKAVGPYTLISPLSALNCYYYRAVAWRHNGHHWKRAAQETLYAPFFVDDGTGRLLVDPRGAEMELPAIFAHEYADTMLDSEIIPDYIGHFLRRHGIPAECPLKLEEYCVLPGDTLFVLGTLGENPQHDANDLDAVNALQRGPEFVSQAAADLQRRGELEFLAPGTQETSPPKSPVEPLEQFDLQPPVALIKGPSANPFFISWCSQREIVLTLSWRAFLYIWVGPILTLICLWLLVSGPVGR